MKKSMGRLGLYLCVLLFIAATDAGRKLVKTHHRHEFPLPSPDNCATVQSFEVGHKYLYNYEATIVSQNNRSQDANNGKKISCAQVQIRVPRPCVGVLSIRNCNVKESKLLPNGSLTFVEGDVQFEKVLAKNNLYFYFNEGEISKVFHHRREQTEAINIKRGMLSALQLKYNFNQLKTKQPGHVVEIPERNIFGEGRSVAEVQTVSRGLASDVKVFRDLEKFELPWSRHQWNTLRSVLDGSDAGDLVSDIFADQSKNMTGNSTQTCDYKLYRGRRVTEVNCLEQKPVNLFNNSIFKLLLGEKNQRNFSSNTTVALKMKQIPINNNLRGERMRKGDALHPRENEQIKSHYVEENLMFQAEWEEVFDGIFKNFEPVDAIMALVSKPLNESSPGLFSKLGRFVTRMSERELERTWRRVQRKTHENYETTVKATNVWIQLLRGCTSKTYWCSLPDYQPNLSCQASLTNFIQASSFMSLPQAVKNGVIEAIATMTKPEVSVISTALDICRLNTTSKTVIMLGKVTKRYSDEEGFDKQAPKFLEAKQFLRDQLQRCNVRQSSLYHDKNVKIAAMKSIGALGEAGVYARDELLQCALNVAAPKELSLTAIMALQEMPATEEVRNQLMRNLENENRLPSIRLSSYLFIMSKEPSVRQVYGILLVAQRETEPKALKYYMSNHIKSQLQLRNTTYCELSSRTIQNIMEAVRTERIPPLGIDLNEVLTEKTTEMTKEIMVPFINQEINCTVSTSLVYTQQSLVPILANVTVLTQIEDKNITLLETVLDFSKILAILDPLMGEQGLLPKQGLEGFLNMPLSTLIRPLLREAPLLLSQDELHKLLMVQDEGFLSYATLLMKNKSPFEIKVLGVPLNSETLMKIPYLKDLKVKDMWKIVEALEQGFKLNGIFADQPLLAHAASPSSFGSPHILHIEAAYFADLSTNITAPVKRLLLTREGRINVDAKNAIKSSFMWSQKIQFPKSLSCGTGYQISVGHKSKLGGSLALERNTITIEMQPLLPETEIIRIQMEELALVNGTVKLIVPQQQQQQQQQRRQQQQQQWQEEQCPSTCVWPLSNCVGNALYYKGCMKPLVHLGFYLRSTETQTSRYVISMEAQPRREGQAPNVHGGRIAIQRGSSSNSNVASIEASYDQENQEMRVDITKNGQQWKSIAGKALISFMTPSDSVQLIDQFLVSLNVTSRPENVVAVNKLFITQQPQEHPDLLKFLVMSDSQRNQNKVKYNIDSAIDVLGQIQFSGKGELVVKKQYGEYDADVKVTTGISGNGQQVAVLNVTTSKTRHDNMDGFKTSVVLQDTKPHLIIGNSSIFSVFMNRITRVEMLSRFLNDSQDNAKHDMFGKIFTNPNQDPYFFYSGSHMQQMKTVGRYVLHSTQTFNKAQFQLDVVSPKPTKIEMTQRLVIPCSSIPDEVMSKHYHHRVEQNDPQLKPTTYIALMNVESKKSGEVKFEAKLNKHQFVESEENHLQQKTFGGIKYVVTKQGYEFHVEIEGLKLKSEYTNQQKSFGHMLLFDMDPSYMKYAPISNQTKQFLRHYAYSTSKNSLKIGYIFKTNNSQRVSFNEVGYFIGDKKLDVVSNISMNNFPYDLTNADIRLNITCEDCLIVVSTSFKTSLGYVSKLYDVRRTHDNNMIKKHYFDAFYGLEVRDGIEAGVGLQYEITKEHYEILDLTSTANISFASHNSIIKPYVPTCLFYYTAWNMTRIQRGDGEFVPTIYNVSYPLGFYKEAPWIIGTFSYSKVTPQQQMKMSKICPRGSICQNYTMDLVQTDKCKDYRAFYSNQQQKPKNCTEQTLSYIASSDGTWNLSMKHDGTRNPDLTFKQVSYDSMYDTDLVLKRNFTLEMATHFSSSPIKLGVNVTATRDSNEYELALTSDDVNANVTKRIDSRQLTAKASTQNIPLVLNCTLQGFETSSLDLVYQVQDCRFAHPYLTGSDLVQIRGNGKIGSQQNYVFNSSVVNTTTHERIVSMQTAAGAKGYESKILCGPENAAKSPCRIELQGDFSTVTYSAKINTTMLNHTAEVKVSGLSSNYISDILADIETSTVLKLQPKVGCPWERSSCGKNQYQFDAKVKNNKINLVLIDGNWSSTSMTKKPYAFYMHYINDEQVDLDIKLATSIGKEWNVESRVYQGMNLPNRKPYMESQTTGSYLEMYYLKYNKCLRNLTVSVKNLYDRPQVQRRSLIKQETKARSNLWPIRCNTEWQEIFRQIFPITPITPVCAGDMEVNLSYDKLNYNQLKVKVFRENNPLLKVIYQLKNGEHNLTTVCQEEQNSTCHVVALIGQRSLVINSTVSIELLHHRSNLSLTVESSARLGKPEQLHFNVVSNSTINPTSNPIKVDAEVTYSDQESWFVSTRMNSSKLQDNIILIQNGTLKRVQLLGKSVVILSIPRDWNVSYKNDQTDYELKADIKLDAESRLIASHYEGQNKPESVFHHVEAQRNAYVEGFIWNYTNCEDRAVMKWTLLLEQKGGRHLSTQSLADIDMWPLKSTSYLNIPVISSCMYCLGDLQFTGIYNSTVHKQAQIKLLLNQASLLGLNYTFGKISHPQTTEYFLLGLTELAYNIQQEQSPRMLVGTNATVMSGRLSAVNVTLLRRGFTSYNGVIQQNVKYVSTQDLKYLISVDTEPLSLKIDVERKQEMTKLSLKYPQTSNKTIMIKLRNNEVEVNDFVVKVASSEIRLNKVIFAILRDHSRYAATIRGVEMNQLNLHIASNLHHQQPDVVRVSGQARAATGEKWFVNIFDTEHSKFVITSDITFPQSDVVSKSFVKIRLPFMTMDLDGQTTWLSTRLQNTYEGKMQWIHCTSNRLVPVFKLEIRDLLQKTRECVYHGKLAWQMNVWSPSYSSFHINPVLNVSINPMQRPVNGVENNMTLVLKSGDHKLQSEIDFSSQMQSYLTVLSMYNKNLVVCIPRIATAATQVQLPLIESTHQAEIKQGKFYVRSEANVSMPMLFNYIKTKAMNLTNVVDLKTSSHNLLVGGIYTNGSILYPVSMPYNSTLNITQVINLSNRNVARKIDFIQRIGQNQTIQFNISGPSVQGKRRLSLKSSEKEILSASVSVSECAMPLPLFPEHLCLPQLMQIKNITADIPLAFPLPQITLLEMFVPEVHPFDVSIRNSSVSVVTLKRGNHWNITSQSSLRVQLNARPLEDEVPHILSVPLRRLESREFEIMNTTLSVARTPRGIETKLNSAMLTSIIDDQVQLELVNLLTAQKVGLQVKTKSLLKKLIPVDMDWEFNNDLSTNQWTFEVRSFNFKLFESVNGEVSFKAHSDVMKNTSIQWKVHSKKTPFFNHGMGVKIEQKSKYHPVSVKTQLNNSFFAVKTSHEQQAQVFNYKMNLRLPSGFQVVNVTFVKQRSFGQDHLIVQTNTTKYTCQNSKPEFTVFNLNCSVQQIDENGIVQEQNQDMKLYNISIPSTPSAAINLARNLIYAKATNQSQVKSILETVFGIKDKQVQEQLSQYLNNISSQFQDNIKGLSQLSQTKQWQEYISNINKAIPLIFPTAEYVRKALVQIQPMVTSMYRMKVINESNFLALQYNVTSKPTDAMLQINITTIKNVPMVNISLFTPQSEMFVLLNIGNLHLYKPISLGVKSLTSPNNLKMNFTCQSTSHPCISAELVTSNSNKYSCIGQKPAPYSMQYNVVCNKIRQDQTKQEVSRFVIPTPTVMKSIKTLLTLTKHYIQGTLEAYLDQVMQIQSRTPFSNDLTRTVSESYETIRQICFSVFPERMLHMHQIERITKEVATLGLDQLKKLYDEREPGVSPMSLARSAVNYLSESSSQRGVKIPITTFTFLPYVNDVYIELGKSDKKVALVMDTVFSGKPDLKQEMRADLFYVEKSPLVRCSVTNLLVVASMDMSLSNMTLVRASIGLPNSEERVNVTYVGHPRSQMMHYQATFVDTESSKHLCDLQQTNSDSVVVRCIATRLGQTMPQPVCQFQMPVSSLSAMSLLTEASLLIPEMYVAAMNPEMLKRQVKSSFKIMDEHRLQLIIDYLSKVSKRNIDIVNRQWVQYYAEKVTPLPSSLVKAWSHNSINAVMTYPRLHQYARGERSMKKSLSDSAQDFVTAAIKKTETTLNTVRRTCQDIDMIAKQLSKVFVPSFIPMSNVSQVYNVTDFVNDIRVLIEDFNKVGYIGQMVLVKPYLVKDVVPEALNEIELYQYLVGMLKITGPTAEWITGPQRSKIISYNQDFYALPRVHTHSDCKYVYVTDPLSNQFNIMSKGDSLLLVFPEMIVEMTPTKRVFVTSRNSAKREVVLPFASDEVFCQSVKGQPAIECKCMQYSVMVKSNPLQQVHRYVTIYDPTFAMGVMGVQSIIPVQQIQLRPNGNRPATPAGLVNAFALSTTARCLVPEPRIQTLAQTETTCSQICQNLFNSPEIVNAKNALPKLFKEYLTSCTNNCQNNNKIQACIAVEEFVMAARWRRVPVKDVKSCLSCNVPANKPVRAETSEVYVLVSLSRDVSQNIKSTLQTLISKLFIRMREQGLSDSKVGIVTYGGAGDKFNSQNTVLNGQSVTSNLEELQRIIESLNFNGPVYNPITTKNAIDFVARYMKKAPSGIIKSVLVVAPESEQQNCGHLNMKNQTQMILSDMSSVFMWCQMSQDQCQRQNQQVVIQTGGVCMKPSRGTESEQEMVNSIVNKISQDIGKQLACQCKTKDPQTGEIQSKCNVVNDTIRY